MIAKQLETVRAEIPENVTLIAVSKTKPLADLQAAYDAGQRHFGENKVQEARNKWSELLKLNPKINLHMLGKIQSNKIDEIVNIFSFVHSLDNEKNSINKILNC